MLQIITLLPLTQLFIGISIRS